MLRRFFVAAVGAIVLLVGVTAGTALADDYDGHIHALVLWNPFTPQGTTYVNGYCDVDYHPTGDISNVVAPTDWTVQVVGVADSHIEISIDHPYYSGSGYEFVDLDFTCTAEGGA